MKAGLRMREIGGYIELDRYTGPMLYQNGIALNCGRNALAYIIRAKGIKRIHIPFFLCDSVANVCKREGAEVVYYHIKEDFKPEDQLEIEKSDYFYL